MGLRGTLFTRTFYFGANSSWNTCGIWIHICLKFCLQSFSVLVLHLANFSSSLHECRCKNTLFMMFLLSIFFFLIKYSSFVLQIQILKLKERNARMSPYIICTERFGIEGPECSHGQCQEYWLRPFEFMGNVSWQISMNVIIMRIYRMLWWCLGKRIHNGSSICKFIYFFRKDDAGRHSESDRISLYRGNRWVSRVIQKKLSVVCDIALYGNELWTGKWLRVQWLKRKQTWKSSLHAKM